MVALDEIVTYLDDLLEIGSVPDDRSNNGLQVEGGKVINKIVFGVDACIELFDEAVKENADLIFVHHGLSWGSSLKYLTEDNAARLKLLFNHNISLYAAHLPLDAHPVVGHNACIADLLELDERETFAKFSGRDCGISGCLKKAKTLSDIAGIVERKLDDQITDTSDFKVVSSNGTKNGCYIQGNKSRLIKKVGVISGGAGSDGVLAAIRNKADCLITGEFTHTSYHLAKENDFPVIAPGHYMTEIPGVIKVMSLLRDKFDIDVKFIHIPTYL